MKKFKLEKLRWDSDFFGYDVGKMVIENSPASLNLTDIEKQNKVFSLCYVFSESELVNDLSLFQDEKIIFEISVQQARDFQDELIRSATLDDFEELKSLAFASGEYSRFKLDPKFNRSEFERLYSEWLLRSLDRTIATEVLLCSKNNEVVGFVTLLQMASHIEIGLIAIKEQFRGRGIGSSLLRVVMRYASVNNYAVIKVATQRRNQDAIIFYERNGFHETESTFIYHLWK